MARTPPNCVFEVDDFEDDWVYKKQFDFIHGRELEGCISDDLLLFQRVFKSLVPNGYIEFQGVEARFVSDDGTLEKATNAQQWMQTLRDASVKFGKPLNSAPSWKDKVIEAGFVDVKHEVRKVHINSPGNALTQIALLTYLAAYWRVAQGPQAQGNRKISIDSRIASCRLIHTPALQPGPRLEHR